LALDAIRRKDDYDGAQLDQGNDFGARLFANQSSVTVVKSDMRYSTRLLMSLESYRAGFPISFALKNLPSNQIPRPPCLKNRQRSSTQLRRL
jgi:hypothetical protein